MIRETFQQYNETDPLRKVIIGRYKGYRNVDAYIERVNESQQDRLPSKTKLQAEFKVFEETLANHGVEVLIPEYVGKFVYDQLTPRDIGITIGNKFVLCNMAKSSRRYEAAGIFRHILSMNGKEPSILIPPNPEILLEGGDVIVDKGFIFVGQTQRTNKAGINYLIQTFEPEFDVIPLACKNFGENGNILHLDCVFNPVGAHHALIYSPGLKHIPKAITNNYELIEVDGDAQQALATNVLSVNQKLVITRDDSHCRPVNESLRKQGIQVITFPFDGAPATGGSFRCCSLPLVRANHTN